MFPDKVKLQKSTGFPVEVFDEIPSTNDYAKELIKSGESSLRIVVAKNQTGGHGRGDKRFFCYDGGIYMSIIIPKERVLIHANILTSAVAAAVCRALRGTACVPAEIKWVNDIYLHGKKICGILAIDAGDAYIVGIGVNAKPAKFPDEIRVTAAALDYEGDLNLLAAQIIKNLFSALTEAPERIINYCREHSFTLGKSVEYLQNGILHFGIAEILFPDGTLGVRKSNGTLDILSSGEVSVKPIT